MNKIDKLQCEKHSKKIMTICTLEECKNQKLCSDCFKTHEPSHVKHFKHLDDLDNIKLNQLYTEKCEKNVIKKHQLDEMKTKVFSKTEELINNFIAELGSSLWEKYSKIINEIFNEYESTILKSEKEMRDQLEKLKLNDTLEFKASTCLKIEEKSEQLKLIFENLVQEIKDIQSALEKNCKNLKDNLFTINYLPSKLQLKIVESSRLQNKCKIIFDEIEEDSYQLIFNTEGIMSLKSLDGVFKKNTKIINSDEKPVKFLNNHNVNSLIKIENIFYFIDDDLTFNKYTHQSGTCERLILLDLAKHEIKKHCLLKYKEDIVLISTAASDQVRITYYNSNLKVIKEKELEVKISSNFYAFEMLGNIYLINLETRKIQHCYSINDDSVNNMNIEIITKDMENLSYYNGKLYVVDKHGNLYLIQIYFL
jgi:endonuclease III